MFLKCLSSHFKLLTIFENIITLFKLNVFCQLIIITQIINGANIGITVILFIFRHVKVADVYKV